MQEKIFRLGPLAFFMTPIDDFAPWGAIVGSFLWVCAGYRIDIIRTAFAMRQYTRALISQLPTGMLLR